MPENNVTINLDYDIIQQEANSIANCADSIMAVAQNVQRINAEMSNVWESATQEAFEEKLDWCIQSIFPQMSEVCEDMSTLLTSTAKTMKATDTNIGNAIQTGLQAAIDAVFGH